MQFSLPFYRIVGDQGLSEAQLVGHLIGLKVYFNDGLVGRVGEATTTHHCQEFALLGGEKAAGRDVGSVLPDVSLVGGTADADFGPLVYFLLSEREPVKVSGHVAVGVCASIAHQLVPTLVEDQGRRVDAYLFLKWKRPHSSIFHLDKRVDTSTSIRSESMACPYSPSSSPPQM